jgi:uncharacterized protein YbjT (DUF2867 family)
MTSTYLVLGGTGKTGRRITRRLVEAGLTARPGSRTPAPPAPGTSPVRFDWDDRSSWHPALQGVDGAYIVPPAFRMDYAPLAGELAAQAVDLGLSRLVFLSARGADQGPDNHLIAAERAIRQAAGGRAGVTVVRPSWFMQNFTEAFFAPGVGEGQLVSPTGDGAEPFIDAEDIAAVAVAALTEDHHAGRSYDLSGPAALTFAEVADVLSRQLARPVRHVDLPLEQWQAGAVQSGLPKDYVEMLAMLFSLIAAGQDAHLSTGVQDALGRPATSFQQWVDREVGRPTAAEPATEQLSA